MLSSEEGGELDQESVRVAVLGAAAFVGVLVLVPLVRHVAIGYGITDRPGKGKLHTSVTPYLGGVAMVVIALGTSSFLPQWSVQGISILVGAAVVATVGLVDDVRTIGPGPRLAVEVLAASLAFAVGARVHLLGDVGDFALTVGWIVVVTNAFNLLDNMDGAASAMASSVAIALVAAAVLEHQVLVGGLAAVVAGSCLGFLVHNWHPARIFMGDAGSLFIGFLIAAISLKLRFAVGPPADVVAVLLLVGPALFDTTLVVASRVRARRPIFSGGTDHTSHRLLRLGLSTHASVLALGAGTALCAGLGVAVGRGAVTPVVLAPVAAVGIALLVSLLRMPVYDEVVAPLPLVRLPVEEVLASQPKS